MRLKLLCVFGTRPEAIKMAPLVQALQANEAFETYVCVTGQHREMLDQVLKLYDIEPDIDFNIMQPGQDLVDISSKVMLHTRDVIKDYRPDIVFVHGDTSTCFAAGLAAFYCGVAIAHVEAGLRTGDLQAPFPEEANRLLVSHLVAFHFCPTETARQNLLQQGISDDKIWVTGNTVIDALYWVLARLEQQYNEQHWQQVFGLDLSERIINPGRELVLITGHRRENFGQGFEDLCQALKQLAQAHPNWDLVYPVHLNPQVQEPVYRLLAELDNVHLIAPQQYENFVYLMNAADLVLTDSGGIQEEAPALGKPVVVTREVTERPEAVAAGTVVLVGTQTAKIVAQVEAILLDEQVYQRMSQAHNPYGDGKAVERIVEALK